MSKPITSAADVSPVPTHDLSAPAVEDRTKAVAANLLASGVEPNALTVVAYSDPVRPNVDLSEVYFALQAGGDAVKAGDLSAIEGLMASQMAALNMIFSELARRAALYMGTNLDATDRYLRLALRAQSQSRATAETIAAIKAGPPIFAQQANVANGPQQVNNGTGSRRARERARRPIKQPELLELSDADRLDTRTSSAAGGSDSPLEAVDAKYRPDDARR